MSLKNILFACLLSLTALPAAAFGPESFQAREVKVKNVFGRLDVTVVEGAGSVEARVTGPQKRLDEVTVRMERGVLVIDQDRPRREFSLRDRDDMIQVTLTVPAGTALTVADFIGEGQVGDLRGPLTLDDMHDGRFTAGDVSTAKIAIAGDADITLGRVDRDLATTIKGDGHIRSGATTGKVEVKIHGDGEVDLARVQGSLAISIHGRGNIDVAEGRIDPLAVSIVGDGDVTVKGTVGQPSISRIGGGKVTVNGQAR